MQRRSLLAASATQAGGGGGFPPLVGARGFSWGRNAYGQCGQGSVSAYIQSPTQIGSASNWAVLKSRGLTSLGITQDGKLWAWGRNNRGQLGLGDLTHRSSPTQVGSGTNWQDIAVGYGGVIAITNNGKAWSWGMNNTGCLGLGDVVDRSSPTQVGSGAIWAFAETYGYSSILINSSGNLFMFGGGGWEASGVLGNGTLTPRSSPTQVGTGSSWLTASTGGRTTLAVKTDGTAWSWGLGSTGQRGTGNLLDVSSPVQIGTGTGWTAVDNGPTSGNSLGIRNGKNYSWGGAAWGRLGNGTLADVSSPVQIGSATDWTGDRNCGQGTMAVQGGKLFGWGKNVSYNMSNAWPDSQYRSSPVQVGTGTGWLTVAGHKTGVARRT